jgi:hypothetical protein
MGANEGATSAGRDVNTGDDQCICLPVQTAVLEWNHVKDGLRVHPEHPWALGAGVRCASISGACGIYLRRCDISDQPEQKNYRFCSAAL